MITLPLLLEVVDQETHHQLHLLKEILVVHQGKINSQVVAVVQVNQDNLVIIIMKDQVEMVEMV